MRGLVCGLGMKCKRHVQGGRRGNARRKNGGSSSRARGSSRSSKEVGGQGGPGTLRCIWGYEPDAGGSKHRWRQEARLAVTVNQPGAPQSLLAKS